MRWLRQLACRAVWTALEGRPGPVHLNFALREPLVLDAPLPADEPGGGGRAGGRPWVTRPRSRRRARRPRCSTRSAASWSSARARCSSPAGQERDPRLAAALAAFAERAGIPLLAEPTSGARRGPAAVAHYDALLRDPAFGAARRPDLVLRVGDLPTSKPLRHVAARPRRCHAADRLRPRERLAGPGRRRGDARPRRPARGPGRAHRAAPAQAARPRLARGVDARRTAAPPARSRRRSGDELTEPRVAAELGVRLPAEATLRRRLLDADPRRRDVLPRAPARRRASSPTAARTASTGPSRRRSASPPPRPARSCC